MHRSHGLQHLRHKRPTFAFTSESGLHTRLCSKDRTHGLTRRNTGVSDGGGIFTLGAFHTFRKPCVAKYQNGKLCRFWVLAGCTPEERRKPAEQRCAYACRCSAGVAAPLGCVIFFASAEIAVSTPCAQGLSVCARQGVVSLPSVRFACCRNAGRPLVKKAHLPFSEVDGHCSPRDAYFLANIQVSLSVISVANVFALWYDKSYKSGLFGDEGEPE